MTSLAPRIKGLIPTSLLTDPGQRRPDGLGRAVGPQGPARPAQPPQALQTLSQTAWECRLPQRLQPQSRSCSLLETSVAARGTQRAPPSPARPMVGGEGWDLLLSGQRRPCEAEALGAVTSSTPCTARSTEHRARRAPRHVRVTTGVWSWGGWHPGDAHLERPRAGEQLRHHTGRGTCRGLGAARTPREAQKLFYVTADGF